MAEPDFAAAWAAGRSRSLLPAATEALAFAHEMSSVASPRATSAAGLTRREQEVLTLLVEGQTDPQIAAALFISKRTVRAHVATILTKLNVPSRTAAAVHATRHRLI